MATDDGRDQGKVLRYHQGCDGCGHDMVSPMLSATVTYPVCAHGMVVYPLPYGTQLSDYTMERYVRSYLTRVGATPVRYDAIT